MLPYFLVRLRNPFVGRNKSEGASDCSLAFLLPIDSVSFCASFMFDFLASLHWGAVFQIIVIDILLGGDNAVVIALACRNLPAEQRTRGVLFGTIGAIVLRVALISFAVLLLDIPFLKFVGGLMLLWIGVKMM